MRAVERENPQLAGVLPKTYQIEEHQKTSAKTTALSIHGVERVTIPGVFAAFKVRAILTTDWIKTAQSRARVRGAIEETLDEGLPRAYTPDVFKTKAGVLFQHVYEHYGRAA